MTDNSRHLSSERSEEIRTSSGSTAENHASAHLMSEVSKNREHCQKLFIEDLDQRQKGSAIMLPEHTLNGFIIDGCFPTNTDGEGGTQPSSLAGESGTASEKPVVLSPSQKLEDGKEIPIPTFVCGEGGLDPSTTGIGGEGGWNPFRPTHGFGEAGPHPRLTIGGGEDGWYPSRMTGEAGPEPITLAIRECGWEPIPDIGMTTKAVGEEGAGLKPEPDNHYKPPVKDDDSIIDGNSTKMVGEEGSAPKPWGPEATEKANLSDHIHRITTYAVGEEGQGIKLEIPPIDFDPDDISDGDDQALPVQPKPIGHEKHPITTYAVGEEGTGLKPPFVPDLMQKLTRPDTNDCKEPLVPIKVTEKVGEGGTAGKPIGK